MKAVADYIHSLGLNICNPFVPYTGAHPAWDSYKFGPSTGNSWRTDTDIGFVHSIQFSDVLRNLDDDAKHPEAAGPGHWNDPDYLGPELVTNNGRHAVEKASLKVAAPAAWTVSPLSATTASLPWTSPPRPAARTPATRRATRSTAT